MKGMKKAISAVLTVLTTAALAVTVYAADYADGPVFPTTPASPVGASAATAVGGAVDKAVSDAAASVASGSASVNVSSVASLPISSSVIKALSNSEDSVLEIVSPKATISIDASTIKKVRKVDLSAKIYGSTSRSVVDLRSKKDFGCEVKITVTSCKMSTAKLANAHVYLDGVDLGPVEIDEDGNPVITVTKGGKYEIK